MVRTLDHLLRAVRGLMRTQCLPRPDRLIISTSSRSVHAEFASGGDVERLAALLAWTLAFEGTSLAWSHRTGGLLTVVATGHTSTGLTVGLAATASIPALGGHLLPGPTPIAVLPGGARLAVFDHTPITTTDLAQVITTAHQHPASSALRVVA